MRLLGRLYVLLFVISCALFITCAEDTRANNASFVKMLIQDMVEVSDNWTKAGTERSLNRSGMEMTYEITDTSVTKGLTISLSLNYNRNESVLSGQGTIDFNYSGYVIAGHVLNGSLHCAYNFSYDGIAVITLTTGGSVDIDAESTIKVADNVKGKLVFNNMKNKVTLYANGKTTFQYLEGTIALDEKPINPANVMK
jgi:hypothetical protein